MVCEPSDSFAKRGRVGELIPGGVDVAAMLPLRPPPPPPAGAGKGAPGKFAALGLLPTVPPRKPVGRDPGAGSAWRCATLFCVSSVYLYPATGSVISTITGIDAWCAPIP